MKNIHILPTDKPSRLIMYSKLLGTFRLSDEPCNDWKGRLNIYITNDEEIKEGDSVILKSGRLTKAELNNGTLGFKTIDGIAFLYFQEGDKKIILTTDQDLIKDGLQAIDDKFLEWFVKNPSCEEVEVQKWFDGVYFTEYKITIPKEEYKYPIDGYAPGYYMCTCSTCKKQFQGDKRAVQCEPCAIEMIKKEPKSLMEKLKPLQEQWQRDMLKSLQEPKQETLEEAAEKFVNNTRLKNPKSIFCEGAKWQQERSYSEEEVYNIVEQAIKDNSSKQLHFFDGGYSNPIYTNLKKWFEQFKKK